MVIEKTNQDKVLLRKIGSKIKARRLEKGLSRPAMAKRIGYKTPYSIYLLEMGRLISLDLIVVKRVAKVLEVSFAKLTQ